MTANGWIQIGAFLVAVLALTKPLGVFMARVFNREWTFLDPVMRPVERLVYRLTGVDEQREMRWTQYTIAMMLFTGVSMLLLYFMERFQKWLPLNPQHLPNVPPDLALNTAVSFTTNTNWQASPTTSSPRRRLASCSPSPWCAASPGMKPTPLATSGWT